MFFKMQVVIISFEKEAIILGWLAMYTMMNKLFKVFLNAADKSTKKHLQYSMAGIAANAAALERQQRIARI